MKRPSFSAFFQAMHGYAPFPWQERLARVVLEQGWPSLLDLPTGSGKTSAMEVALYALAAAPERMPRRIVLVVDRRIVVDQGAELAKHLRRQLRAGKDEVSVEIARRLRAIWGGAAHDDPFAVAVMRGGMPRDNDWAKRPDQPVLGVSTIDQVGSRLLFRGYGISPRSASIYAGLMGNDTLILLDEVHLAAAFAETLDSIQKHHRKQQVAGLPSRFKAVPMSATPGSRPEGAFSLDASDRAHQVLKQRLGASKPAKLEAIDVRGDNEASKREVLAERAVAEALKLQAAGAKVVGLVVNRVDTARLAWALLEKHEPAIDRLLVTGRTRPLERDHLVRTQLLPRAGGTRTRSDEARPLIVVATQCIEAGADLDFDGLVTECASLDALRQRFGRLDRRGEVSKRDGHAPAVILCRSDLAAGREDDPIYEKRLAATWKWLLGEAGKRGVVDFGIDAMSERLPEGEALRALLAPENHAPVLLPAHLDSWVHTSPILQPSPDPDPSLWLHGPERNSREVQVVWRADLEDERGERRPIDAVEELLELTRPAALEAMSLPLHVVAAWLGQRRDERGMSDVLAESEDDEREGGWRKGGGAKEGTSHRFFVVRRRDARPRWGRLATTEERRSTGDGDGAVEKRGSDEIMELRSGDMVIVPSRYGGINRDGTFDPSAEQPALDLGDLAQLRGRGQPTLRLEPGALACWGLDEAVVNARPKPVEEERAAEAKQRVKEWGEAWPASPPESFFGTKAEWEALVRSLKGLRRRPREVGAGFLAVVEDKLKATSRGDDRVDDVSDAVTEDDDSSFQAASLSLRAHSGDVEREARRFGEQVGFGAALVDDLALAGWLHDVGKADPRFQRWLVGGDEVRSSMLDEPLAKSSLAPGNRAQRELAQKRAGVPRGFRHELVSLAMIERSEAALAKAHDRELVLHLVASHHGWCRPFAPALDEPEAVQVTLMHGDAERGLSLEASSRHRAGRLDSGVAQRFWALVEKYGWWGLAWLESVIRLADHRASERAAAIAKEGA